LKIYDFNFYSKSQVIYSLDFYTHLTPKLSNELKLKTDLPRQARDTIRRNSTCLHSQTPMARHEQTPRKAWGVSNDGGEGSRSLSRCSCNARSTPIRRLNRLPVCLRSLFGRAVGPLSTPKTIQKKQKARMGFCFFGGGEGSRTPVRKPSHGETTCLVFNCFLAFIVPKDRSSQMPATKISPPAKLPDREPSRICITSFAAPREGYTKDVAGLN